MTGMFAVRYPIVLAESLHRMTMWTFIEVLIYIFFASGMKWDCV